MESMRYKPWTTMEINTMMAMKIEGEKIKDIAKALGRPYASTSNKYRENVEVSTSDKVKAAKEYLKNNPNATSLRLHKKFGLSRCSIFRYRKELGFSSELNISPRLSKEEVIKIRTMQEQGFTITEVSKLFNIKYVTAYKIFSKATYKNIKIGD